MAFPTSNLDFELEIGTGNLELGPNRWTWTDVTDRVDPQTVPVRRGRSDENAVPQPASLGVVLANLDGELTPEDPRSTLWPNLKKGTPVRYTVEGAQQALLCRGGEGEHCLAPHVDAFDMTADFDVRIRLDPDMWSHSVPYNTIPLVGVWGEEGDRSWVLNLAGPGRLNLFHSTSGVGWFPATTRQVVAALRPEWIGCTYEPSVNDGSARRITYYRTSTETPDPDITTWELVESIERGTPRSVWADGAGALRIGHYNDSDANSLRGRVLAVELRDGINGTVVADPDFTGTAEGDTTVTDSAGNTFTVGPTAELSTKATYYVGSIDDAAPIWPHGDNHENSSKPSEALVSWSTAGPLRRMQTGKKPLKSSWYRLATNSRWTEYLATYIPCEEQPGADRFSSPFTNQAPATVSGIDVGSNTTLPASGRLPTIQSGKTGSWRAEVNDGPTGTWNFSMAFLMPQQPDSPDWTQMFYVEAQGTIRRWSVELNNGGRRLTGYDGSGNIVTQSTGGLAGLDFDDWHIIRLKVETVGGAINWNVRFISIASGGGVDFNDSVIGTSGRVTAVGNETVGPGEGLAFGHVTVDDGTPPVSWTAGADTAWVGETAAHRFYRLCTEEGVEAEVIGDPTVAIGDTRGTEGLTYMMGPQRQLPLVDLLLECAGLDQGVIYERRGGPGLVFRTRRTLEAQDPVAVLDAQAEEIRNPFEPRYDDKDLANDVTVQAVAGSSARAVDDTSVTDSGLYDVEREVNSVGGVEIQAAIIGAQLGLQDEIDNQNEDMAAWFLHLGTWPGMRYPTISTDLALSARMPALWHTLRLGDRIRVTNLPAQHPASDVDLIVQQISDPFQPADWQPTATCSPGGPWALPRLSAGADPTEPARLAADTAPALTAGVDAAATDLPLGTTDWTDDPDDYPLQVVVGGEVVEAAGVNTDGNYTLTGCVRSVNGVERAHPAGTTVQVATGYRLALGPGDYRADPSDDDDGFTLLIASDFSEPDPLADYRIYDGAPGSVNGNNGWGARRASQVTIEDHPDEGKVLTITGEMGTGLDAGLLLHSGAKPGTAIDQQYRFRYGRVRFRLRVDGDPDEVTSGLGLLWQADTPAVKGPEVNIVENFRNRDTRSPIDSFVHWGENGEFVRGPIAHVGVSATDWHDFELIWKPNLLTVQVDDQSVQVLAVDPTEVPQEDMELVFQLDAWNAEGSAAQPALSGPLVMEVSSFSIETLDDPEL